ncbi:MAG: hypothetical protein QXG39_10090 [Candidatus Aenigmatarchaeota archaeon]
MKNEMKEMIMNEILRHLLNIETYDLEAIERFMTRQDDDIYIPYAIGKIIKTKMEKIEKYEGEYE